jgi:hypothetical protein
MNSGWKYAAASVIGTSHLTSPQGICQDSHECVYIAASDIMLCVVSDGAGSASHSDQGARKVCEAVRHAIASATVSELHTNTFALETLLSIQSELEEASHESGVRLRDYACTLLVAIAAKEQVTFWQIGDGAICFRFTGEESFSYGFWPAKGEYANMTQFVTDARADEELQFDTVKRSITDLAVFSDGLERLALDFKTGEVHDAFFTGLFPYLHRRLPGYSDEIAKQLAIFLDSERVNARTDDDKTLLLASVEGDHAA